MPYDSFSNEDIPKGTGIMYVQKDGRVLYFQSSKTMKNMLNLKRDGRLVRWTKKTVAVVSERKVEEKKDSVLAKEIEAKLAEKKKPEEKKK
jgi:ribosomal protein L24E